jgi:hypothetical protein
VLLGGKMLENDLRKKAKETATHITPPKLRKWIAGKIGKVDTVFDPSVGSGQLLQYVDANKFIGNDIDTTSVEYFKNNFENTECYNDNYFDLPNLDYNVAVANYPFSLNAKDIIDYEKNKDLIDLFFKNGKITGKADWLFIIKTFLQSKDKKGHYIAFPGILYRKNESKFRDFLVSNNYIVSYGIIKNCKFDATAIDVVYLELGENKTGLVDVFLYDLETEKYLIERQDDLSSLIWQSWETPRIEIKEEVIDIELLEIQIKELKERRQMLEDKLDNLIKNELKYY